jgi:hypothetical protein
MESSLWGDDDHVGSATEWTRMSNEFTNVCHLIFYCCDSCLIQHNQAGYREGITAGKESSVQHGFNHGYPIGAALGRQTGFARGSLTAMLSFLTSSRSHSLPDDVRESRTREAHEILALFSDVHVKDITSDRSQTVPDHEMMDQHKEKFARVAELGHNLGYLIRSSDHVVDN